MPKSLRQAARGAKEPKPDAPVTEEPKEAPVVTVKALKAFFWGNAKLAVGEEITVSHSVKEMLSKKGLV